MSATARRRSSPDVSRRRDARRPGRTDDYSGRSRPPACHSRARIDVRRAAQQRSDRHGTAASECRRPCPSRIPRARPRPATLADQARMSSRAQRGICCSLALTADPIYSESRALLAHAPAPLGERSRSARDARATPDKLLRGPASRSLVASLLGMTNARRIVSRQSPPSAPRASIRSPARPFSRDTA